MRRLVVCASVALLAVALGCADKPRSRVHGKVTYQDKPLARAVLTFFGSDNMTYITESRADGTYEIAGVPRGAVKLSLTVAVREPKSGRPDPVPGKSNERAVAEDRAKGARPPPAEAQPSGLLPAKFANPDSSGLSFELTAPDQEYNVDLK
jgi:hypothetical protein